MKDNTIQELLRRIQILEIQQNNAKRELEYLKSKAHELILSKQTDFPKEAIPDFVENPSVTLVEPEQYKISQEQSFQDISVSKSSYSDNIKPKLSKKKSDLEKIIGESWINKVGILILIIGIFLGVKYSIDNNLISPIVRVLLGYLAGISLLMFGFRLRTNYNSYSAVLVSGAMAVFYFITYIAYEQYYLIALLVAFVMMVIFTIFTILASVWYDKMVISIIGLVGAYAVPFLLSSDSGTLWILVSYIFLINIGILVVCIKKSWKIPAYIAFVFTSIIQVYLVAVSTPFQSELLFVYSTLFFIQFYIVIITDRIIYNQKIKVFDVIWLFSNAILYYGIGVYIIHEYINSDFLGLFTILNATIHFGVGLFLKNKKLLDNTLIYSILGLTIAFITIAIPIQLEGMWITLIWGVISALLYWLSVKSREIIYQYFSLALATIAFFSLSFISHLPSELHVVILNTEFLVTIFLGLSYVFILYWYIKSNVFKNKKSIWDIVYSVIISFFAISVFYSAFYNEIYKYFSYKVTQSKILTDALYETYDYNYDYYIFQEIYLIIYSIVFTLGLLYLNRFKIKNKYLGLTVLVFLLLQLFLTTFFGFYQLGELREIYLNQKNVNLYSVGFEYVAIRYLLIGSVVFALYTINKVYRDDYFKNVLDRFRIPIELTIYFFTLYILSNELITWLSLAGYYQAYKLALSILWGIFSLVLVYLGIIKQKKYLRIASITLFGITIIKVFFYDISHLNTIAKIIVFISLGVLLLISSFLYNKFKDKIDNEK